MGLFKKIAGALGISRNELRILVVGLDNSGKTTLVNHIKPKKAEIVEVTPTVGFQVEEFVKNNLNFTIIDMSGQGRYRTLWEHYYRDVQAIIFVVDTTDRVRMCVAKEELYQLMENTEVGKGNMPILIFANKSDMASAMSAVDCMAELELERIKGMPWHITGSNAITGDGVDDGIAWLVDHLSSHK